MDAGKGKLSTLQITSSVGSPPIPRLVALRKTLYQASLQRGSPAAIESPITIVDGMLQERSTWWFLNNSEQFFVDKCLTGAHDTEW